MDSRELECFVAAAESGSISRAAQGLFMSPQGLGKVLRKIEGELGVILFERTQHGIEPTAAGRALYEKSQILLDDFKAVTACVQDGESPRLRKLRLALTYGSSTYLGPAAFDAFRAQHAEIALEIEEFPDESVDAAMRGGSSDAGIIAGPVDALFYHATLLATIRHVAIVPDDHPLALKQSVNYRDLDGETVIMIGRQFRPFQNNLNRLARAGVTPQSTIETNEINKVSQFAARRAGIGISVEFEALDNPHPHTVVLPFDDPHCAWDLYLIHPASKAPSPEVIAFCEFALNWTGSKSSEGFLS